MTKEMKHERLEKLLREELEETGFDRNTPGAPGSGKSNQSNPSTRRAPTIKTN